MHRQTKIVATLGPATDKQGVLEELITSGVNVVRLNFSHGSSANHIARAQQVRHIAKKVGQPVAIMCDLQGPKIRISSFQKGVVSLRNGKQFTLDISLGEKQGNEHAVGVDLPTIVEDCNEDDILLLDDGRIRLRIEKKVPDKLITRVISGGELSDKKGINRLGGGLNATTLTQKDKEDTRSAAEIACDYLALSFAKNAQDVEDLRKLAGQHTFYPQILSKIERTEAVANKSIIDEIILASDAIMVARGDLGVEMGDAQLVGIQKYLIKRAMQLNRVVITATQMMESMVENTIPTRAEVFDVANAVIDGTDAVMLSAETATGKHPAKVIQVMNDVCIGAEKQVEPKKAIHIISDKFFSAIDETIAYASLHTALQLERVKIIVCYTETGNTARWISRVRTHIPILGVSRHPATIAKMALWRGVSPLYFDIVSVPVEELRQLSKRLALQCLPLAAGDRIITTRGSHAGVSSGTDRMQIVEVNEKDIQLNDTRRSDK